MSDVNLLPCMFCGIVPGLVPGHADRYYCPCITQAFTRSEWNRRAIDESGVERVTSLLIDWDRSCSEPFDTRALKLIQAYLGKEREE